MLAAIGLAIGLFFVLGNAKEEPDYAGVGERTTETSGGGGGGSGEPKPEEPAKPEQPKVPVIEVEGGEPVGGVAELEFEQGEEIRFLVRSDVPDHIHLHGYDVFQDVSAGGEARFSVPASEAGIFEAELEDRGVPIAEITVNP